MIILLVKRAFYLKKDLISIALLKTNQPLNAKSSTKHWGQYSKRFCKIQLGLSIHKVKDPKNFEKKVTDLFIYQYGNINDSSWKHKNTRSSDYWYYTSCNKHKIALNRYTIVLELNVMRCSMARRLTYLLLLFKLHVVLVYIKQQHRIA